MISGIVGLPGSGKSLYACEIIMAELNRDRWVATNLPLLPAFPAYDHPKLIGCSDGEAMEFWKWLPRGGVVVLDEADIFWDAADFNQFSGDARIYWKTHRHKRHDIYLIAQSADNFFVRIRRQVQRWIVCEHTMRTRPAMRWLLSPILGRDLTLSLSSFLRCEFGAKIKGNPVNYSGIGYVSASRRFGWYDSYA